jgi:hypothetical protein
MFQPTGSIDHESPYQARFGLGNHSNRTPTVRCRHGSHSAEVSESVAINQAVRAVRYTPSGRLALMNGFNRGIAPRRGDSVAHSLLWVLTEGYPIRKGGFQLVGQAHLGPDESSLSLPLSLWERGRGEGTTIHQSQSAPSPLDGSLMSDVIFGTDHAVDRNPVIEHAVTGCRFWPILGWPWGLFSSAVSPFAMRVWRFYPSRLWRQLRTRSTSLPVRTPAKLVAQWRSVPFSPQRFRVSDPWQSRMFHPSATQALLVPRSGRTVDFGGRHIAGPQDGKSQQNRRDQHPSPETPV